MRMSIIILALALATLPFGMGTMMASASGSHHMHMAGKMAGQSMPMQHRHGGKQMGFTVCGACASMPAQVLAGPFAPTLKGAYLPVAAPGSRGLATMPATPPPRA
jgi:hypothetical protein